MPRVAFKLSSTSHCLPMYLNVSLLTLYVIFIRFFSEPRVGGIDFVYTVNRYMCRSKHALD